MSSRLNEFTRFMNEFGPRAFDQLAIGRLGASITAAAEGIPADVTPIDGLAAHWSTLSSDEKTSFFKRLVAGAPARSRRKARKSARTAVAGKTAAAAAKPKRKAKDDRAADEKKNKKKTTDKKAKKEEKAKAKETKKLRKKEAKAKEKAEKKAKKMAKAAEKKAKAAQLATAP